MGEWLLLTEGKALVITAPFTHQCTKLAKEDWHAHTTPFSSLYSRSLCLPSFSITDFHFHRLQQGAEITTVTFHHNTEKPLSPDIEKLQCLSNQLSGERWATPIGFNDELLIGALAHFLTCIRQTGRHSQNHPGELGSIGSVGIQIQNRLEKKIK